MLCPSQHAWVGFTLLAELEAVGGLTVMPCFYMKVRGKTSPKYETDPASNCVAVFLVKNKKPSQHNRQNCLKFRRTKLCQHHVFKKPQIEKLFIDKHLYWK